MEDRLAGQSFRKNARKFLFTFNWQTVLHAKRYLETDVEGGQDSVKDRYATEKRAHIK